ncbi:MAG: hypothetical protein ACI8S6_002052, partial [Myxococcota bacterium]
MTNRLALLILPSTLLACDSDDTTAELNQLSARI